MMLPEHVSMAKKLFQDIQKEPKPFLDEEEIAEMEQSIRKSFSEGTPLAVTLWDDGMFSTLSGIVAGYSPLDQTVKLKEAERSFRTIPFDRISRIKPL